jgi:hypothetical protein
MGVVCVSHGERCVRLIQGVLVGERDGPEKMRRKTGREAREQRRGIIWWEVGREDQSKKKVVMMEMRG